MEIGETGGSKSITIRADRRYLSVIRDFIHQHAERAGAAPVEIDSLIQAVDEAAANVIIHGYKDGPGEIDVTVSYTSGIITVTITDQAPSFDPTTAPQPDISLPLEQRPVGGLGIHLIRHCVDEIGYAIPSGGGNKLILKKKLHRQ